MQRFGSKLLGIARIFGSRWTLTATGVRRHERALLAGAAAVLLVGAGGVMLAGGRARAQPERSPEPLTITRITPSGDNVPPGRQIVLEFNRPVVPVGRMERRRDQIPIEIAPPLACEWRWLNRSALACELGEDDALRPATRYRLVVSPGIAAEDGATTSGVLRHEFTTQRPRVTYVSFATWRSPGTPVVRAVFTQPVSESSVREHLYFSEPAATPA
ncbi:MAG TPA: hypothetical protein VFV10_02615, partial [Gammaproteobacteria bacterium]|nr:hypothetical protein [Gammaproteobacteria bacterium]